MKNINRFLAALLVIALLIGMTGFTANSAEKAITMPTKVFDGFNLTILDGTTPAVDMRGRTNDRTVMCFVSADGRELGVISYSEYWAVIEKHQTTVLLPEGGMLAVPPDNHESWNMWFADEFNKLRGLNAGSRKDSTETIEKYRQEVIKLVNAEREKASLPALSVDEKAMEYAQTRAHEIIGNYSHTRPNGLEKPSDELGALIENIAFGQSPDVVMSAWMDSPGHRSGILDDDAHALGVGCYWSGTTYYWAQIFLW